MRIRSWGNMSSVMTLLLFLHFLQGIYGIRFVIDKEECLSHNVHLEGDTIHVSFVVVQADTPWHSANEGGVDLMIKGPSGELIHGFRDKTSEKYEFVAYKKGIYQFCFMNKSPYHETLDFDVQVVHYTYYDQHAKNEHFDPLLDQLSKLEAALYNIQFEQHWLEAQTARQALLNEGMSQRAITKALLESVTLVGVCFLQVFLLQRLFENKLQTVRV
ncbi:hypothetical protein MTR67_053190 [Solanum verrucosum]|uniref:GOLD domain-containing protein n=1 Tax=Solanum verrucosum TaxID=315347 RepID=A0AAF0V895_SOLVR|nr:transmembrane emp24 domain-containing protein p24beta2-like [Solanum verrucosum]WMV59805.1 hypothetical protein MTR67_053190 [Solanum verrucosum]